MRRKRFYLTILCFLCICVCLNGESIAANNTVTLPLDNNGVYSIPYYFDDNGEKIYPLYIDADGDAVYADDEPTDAEDLIENWEEKTGKAAPQSVIDAAYAEVGTNTKHIATAQEILQKSSIPWNSVLPVLESIIIGLLILDMLFFIPSLRRMLITRPKSKPWHLNVVIAYPILLGSLVVLTCFHLCLL